MSNETTTAEILLRKTYITSRIRHSAAGRLTLHSWASQWTLALLAVGQIVIGLIVALGLKARFNEPYISFAAIFFSVLVLTYSLLLGMSNFSVRAARFHECALKLGKLSIFINKYINSKEGCERKMDDFIHKYNRILSISENHSPSDFLRYKMKEDDSSCGLSFWYYIKMALQFGHYLLSILMMYIWIFFLVWPEK